MQQINFYQTQFKPKKEILSAFQFLTILSILLVCLIIFSAITIAIQPDPAIKLAKQKQILLQKQQQTDELRQKLENSKENPLLRAKFEETVKTLHEQKALLSYVSSNELGNQKGFSTTLVALSKQNLDEVWLTNFTLVNGGEHIALKGQTSSADIIPKYIDSLAESDVFSGKTFSVFKLQKPDASQFFDFELFTKNTSENK